MTIDDLEAFGRVMTLVNEIYGDPNKEVSDMRMRLYFQALEDLTIGELEAAVFRMSRTKTFRAFPTPGEIREALTGRAEDRAVLAFDTLIDAIHRVGAYRSPSFLDGAIGMAVEVLGGWKAVCDWNVGERQRKRKEFLRVYQTCLVQGVDGPRQCMGEFGRINALAGHGDMIPVPIAIGSVEGRTLLSVL